MDVVERVIKKRKRPTTPRKARQPSAPRSKSLAGKIAHNVLSTMWPRTMAAVDFVRAHMKEEALNEKKKKAKGQEEPMNKPSYNGTNGRQNGPQDGVNDKNDYTDYTISDETLYRESIEGTGVSAAPITQSAPRASKARNAPASAGALQAAASGRIAQKQQFARQEKSVADRNMRGQIDKNQEAQKRDISTAAKQERKMEKKPTAEQIEYVNAMFEKNLEEGMVYIQELSKQTVRNYKTAAEKDRKELIKQVSKDAMNPSPHHKDEESRLRDLHFGMELIDKRNKGIKTANAKLNGTANVPATESVIPFKSKQPAVEKSPEQTKADKTNRAMNHLKKALANRKEKAEDPSASHDDIMKNDAKRNRGIALSIKRLMQEKLEEGMMPTGTIKHKTRLKNMSDKELHAHIGHRNERELRELGWRHGYGKMSDHYVDRVARGKKEIEENY